MARNIDYPVEQVRQWIAEGLTQEEIARRLQKTVDHRITPKLIYKLCKKHGIQCQRTGPRSGPGHPNWKGGRIRNRSGYIEVYCPDHPVVAQRNLKAKQNASGYCHPDNYYEEHRLVAEKQLGRVLFPNEVVHHIDGNKENNQPENLEVFQDNSEHLGQTLRGKVPRWSKAGKAAILAGVERVARTRRKMKEHGVPLSLQTKIRPIDELLKTGHTPSQTAALLKLAPSPAHSKPEQHAAQQSG